MGIRRMLVAPGLAAAMLALAGAGTSSAQPVDASGGVGAQAVLSYQISVTTTDLANAGTDGTVEIRLRGSLSTSPFVPLDNTDDNFERNTTDRFPVPLSDLGTIRSADVRFTPSGGSPDWHLAHISVSTSGRPTVQIPAHRWFSGTQTVNLPVAVDAQTYVIRVVTSDIEDAGTDGTVEVRLNGSLRSSVFFDLDNEDVDNFERGSTNTFSRVYFNLGTLESVDVRFTLGGDSPHWHLSHVSVTPTSGGTSTFVYHRWFERSEQVNRPAG